MMRMDILLAKKTVVCSDMLVLKKMRFVPVRGMSTTDYCWRFAESLLLLVIACNTVKTEINKMNFITALFVLNYM